MPGKTKEGKNMDPLEMITDLSQQLQPLLWALKEFRQEKPRPAVHDETLEPKEIMISVLVKRLFDVDTVAQHFQTRLHLSLRWKMPDFEEAPDPTYDDGDWIPIWTPKFRMFSLEAETHREETYHVSRINGVDYICGDILLILTLSEPMELADFPVDCQNLSINFQLVSPAHQAILVPFPEEEKDSFPPCDVQESEFLLSDFELIPEIPFTFDLFRMTGRKQERCYVRIALKLRRVSAFYVTNVALIMLVLATFVLVTFTVHPGMVAERWEVDFSLILTIVAFKLYLETFLPHLNYSTMLDWYVLGGFMFVCTCTAAHSLVPLLYHSSVAYSPLTLPPMEIEGEEELIYGDHVAAICLVALWVTWNLSCLTLFCVRKQRARADFVKKAFEERGQAHLYFDPQLGPKARK
eukprot:TRINITY_DN9175_c1_g1_i1.p1 TRINITY_DN9175_c1_g1~~TRINITY_DN9175_c1_g1_i1.p1  ORF type:complete len:449 (+),score=52.53 TRINITY_DN9175_c1_g1_i1:121-1347(+)